MIIDTHCHYNLEPLSNNVDTHWKKAQANGVEATINVGSDLENSKLSLEITNKFPKIYASIGIHPGKYTEAIKNLLIGDKYSQDEIDKFVDETLLGIKQILQKEIKNKNSKLVAIGEIGLDYYRLKLKGLKRNLVIETQKTTFEKQLKMAFENNLIAIIHVRDKNERHSNENNAYNDTLEILKKVIEDVSPADTNPKFILHCISGPQSYIKEALSLGAYIGVAGNITYDNAQNLREIIKIVPQNKLLIETDAPYLVPQSLKNKKIAGDQICEPYMIKATAEYLQTEMGINLDIILDNTLKLFLNKINF